MAIKSLDAQQVVFTVQNASSQDEFWKVNVGAPFIYEKITDSINQHAIYSGTNKGPICTSHNGDYYIFQSERFDNNIGGYEAITICKSDFSYFEVPKDGSGNAFHSEGIMQVSNDGQTIYFVQGGGTHTRDIYKIAKSGAVWSAPFELTANTSSAYNISPYLSYNETKLIFESSSTSSFSTSLKEVIATGSGLTAITSIAAVANNCIQIKSPCYDVAGNIYFEAETDAERVWKISATGGTPVIVNNSFGNDNSPITLPDGRIASLHLPGSTHQIKIMDANGLNDFMITTTSGSFTEVFDIGMSAGGNSVSGIEKNNMINSLLTVYPNPSTGLFSLKMKAEGAVKIIVFNMISQNSFSLQYAKWNGTEELNLSSLPTGMYLVKIENKGGFSTQRIVIAK